MKSKWIKNLLFLAMIGGAFAIGYLNWNNLSKLGLSAENPLLPRPAKQEPAGGRIVKVESVTHLTAEEVLRLSKQNYGNNAPQPTTGVTKAVVQFTSYDDQNKPFNVYARIYVPTDNRNLPIFGFAPGTTGIGDACSGSLEQPQKANWANYESHMVTYAGQGYATVITDYEGMRDASRMHHYMVGDLEGRVMLDSVRALKNWDGVKGRLDTSKIILGGYSQGGHAAMWADKIASTYAPELQLRGVVGFGPVMDVKRTLEDVTHGANINWFGPYVLASYGDYYGTHYDLSKILLPQWIPNLVNDVNTHCIDTNIQFWGHTPQGVYTPEFIQALSTDTLAAAGYGDLNNQLEMNAVGDQHTATAKLINSGAEDNVVLPSQQHALLPKLCTNSRGTVNLKIYSNSTHYNTMVHSFTDTLNWMKAVDKGMPVENGCR